jgi:hypothetical protein
VREADADAADGGAAKVAKVAAMLREAVLREAVRSVRLSCPAEAA